MKRSLIISALTASLLSVALTSAYAAETTHKKTVQKKVVKKAHVAAAAAGATTVAAASDVGFNINEATSSVVWNCELGRSLKIYKKDSDLNHIAILWQNRLNPLTRVATTTGADRFEDKRTGLLWIDIPAKGMLLDTKNGSQLANECVFSQNDNIEKTKKG